MVEAGRTKPSLRRSLVRKTDWILRCRLEHSGAAWLAGALRQPVVSTLHRFGVQTSSPRCEESKYCFLSSDGDVWDEREKDEARDREELKQGRIRVSRNERELSLSLSFHSLRLLGTAELVRQRL